MSNTTNKPVYEIRYGAVKATIWVNETSVGPRHNVTLGRLYKDGDEQWRTSDSLGRDDLLTAAKVLDLAHSWIYSQAE